MSADRIWIIANSYLIRTTETRSSGKTFSEEPTRMSADRIWIIANSYLIRTTEMRSNGTFACARMFFEADVIECCQMKKGEAEAWR